MVGLAEFNTEMVQPLQLAVCSHITGSSLTIEFTVSPL